MRTEESEGRPRPQRWQARIEWRDGSQPLLSPLLPWKQAKSYLDGLLARHGGLVEQIIIRRAGETRP